MFFLVPAFSRLERSFALFFAFNKKCSTIQKSKFLLWAWLAHEKGTVGRLERRFGLSQARRRKSRRHGRRQERAFLPLASLSLAPFSTPHCGAHVLKKPETTTGSAVVAQRKTGKGDVVQRPKRKTFPFLFFSVVKEDQFQNFSHLSRKAAKRASGERCCSLSLSLSFSFSPFLSALFQAHHAARRRVVLCSAAPRGELPSPRSGGAPRADSGDVVIDVLELLIDFCS